MTTEQETPFNVFLSWSGERSRAAAEIFSDWLTQAQSRAQPWISTRDITPGKPWFTQIQTRLQLKIGIIFLTPENLESPWPVFEAGAIFRSIGDTGRTFVVLIGFGDKSLPAGHPLAQLHYVHAGRDGFCSIFLELCASLSEAPIDRVMTQKSFEASWGALEARLSGLPNAPTNVPPNPAPATSADVLEAVRAQREQIEELGKAVQEIKASTALIVTRTKRDTLLTQFGGAGPYTVELSGSATNVGPLGRLLASTDAPNGNQLSLSGSIADLASLRAFVGRHEATKEVPAPVVVKTDKPASKSTKGGNKKSK